MGGGFFVYQRYVSNGAFDKKKLFSFLFFLFYHFHAVVVSAFFAYVMAAFHFVALRAFYQSGKSCFKVAGKSLVGSLFGNF